MKKAYLLPVAVLATILAFALWNSAAVTAKTDRWQVQLRQAATLALAEDWPGVSAAMVESYADWSTHQTWLHIVTEHDAIDDAEAMYHRAMAFAATKEPSEFRAEVSDLMAQFRLLAEMERFSIGNIL